MKKALCLLALLVASSAFAQWTGTSPGPIYYNGGNVGIGTSSPSAKLHVDGTAIFTQPLTVGGYQIINMPWTPTWAPPAGYIKLVTPILHDESNMFQLHVYGYRYSPGDTFDIRCSGYAYAGYSLTNTTCHVDGTNLPVELGAETRTIGGTSKTVVVMRIGTPATTWYYAHFAAEYSGWQPKSPAGFQWVVGETTPAQAGNLNNIYADDNTGMLTVSASGTAATSNRLTVNGASTFNGNVSSTGTVSGGNIVAKYQDVAEWVPATEDMLPGTVVVLNPNVDNQVMPSLSPYDTSVAGVVSAQPGLLLGEAAPTKEQIATTGRVKVRVDATAAPIRIGDLLVTSGKSGRAMRSLPVDVSGIAMHRPGTVIGKALEALPGGEGEILVLLSMQ